MGTTAATTRRFIFVSLIGLGCIFTTGQGSPPEATTAGPAPVKDSVQPARSVGSVGYGTAAGSEATFVTVGPVMPATFEGSVRDLPKVDPSEFQGAEPRPRVVAEVGPLPESGQAFEDPLWQKQAVLDLKTPEAGLLSPPILNFDGIASGLSPHDPVGDVGPNHYVQMINVHFAVYDKAGTLLAGPSTIDSLWAGAGGPCETGTGDPIVLYDELADRWLLSQIAAPSHQCVAISQTPDPTGAYYLYTFDMVVFPDFPKLAVWPDAYYQTSNSGGSARVTAFQRPQMLAGLGALHTMGTVAGLPGLGFNIIMPGDLDGPPPPAGAGNFYTRQVDGNAFGGVDRVEVFEFTDPFGAPGFPLVASVPLAPFDAALCGFLSFMCVPQPGTGVLLDPLNEPPMWRTQYRNFGTHQTLVGSFVVDVDGADTHGVRWYELRKIGAAAWTLFQEGTYAPQDGGAPEHRWMSSVAMDAAGNIALAYSISNSSTVFPGIRYAGRVPGDPLGTLPQGEEVIKVGEASMTISNRWGDYSSLNVDPVDGCTFWNTNDYVDIVSGRQTRIATFGFQGCAGVPVCGDGSTDPPETCDPPGIPAGQPDECRIDCTFCGDGVLNGGVGTEECDDGNNADGDGCAADCAIEPLECGNSFITTPETCDPPGGAGCDCCAVNGTPGCTSPACTGVICAADPFCCNTTWDQLCVDAAVLEPICVTCCDAECRENCTSCGDAIVQPGREETCDPPGSPGGEPTLYGAAHVGGPGSPSTLYTINPGTGAAAPVGPIGFNRVGGIDFHPGSRVLFGVAERPIDDVHVLITINPASGVGTEVGPLLNTNPGGHFDISFRADGLLYLTAFEPMSGDLGIFTVNTTTGEATALGPTGTFAPGNALGFDLANTLYHADDVISATAGTLYTVNQGTGASSVLTVLNYLGFPPLSDPRPNAMDFNPSNGVGYTSVNDGSGGSGPNYLARLDPATGNVNLVGLTQPGLDALAWRPPQTGNVCRSDCTSCGDGVVNGSIELLANGDFETGAFAPWVVVDLGVGTFHIAMPGTPTPVSGFPTAPNPGGGDFYAVTDTDNPGAHALLQAFTVPAGGTNVRLSFDMFVNDWSGSGPLIHSSGLNHTAGPNQHARVDILAAGSPPFDTGAGVLANFYLSVDPGPVPNAYTSYDFDISGVVAPGGTYVLRFAEVDNQSFNHQGVDNVSVRVIVEECDDGNRIDGDGCDADCQLECGNGVIDPGETCDPPGSAGCDCCVAKGSPGCTSPLCEAAVCAIDTFCCNTSWDDTCADEALAEPLCLACCDATCRDNCTSCGDGVVQPDREEECEDGNNDPAACDGCNPFCQLDSCGDGFICPPENCEPPGEPIPNSDCCVPHGSPGCEAGGCEAQVCALDSFCCDVEWDQLCANAAVIVGCCPGLCLGCCEDIDADGICDTDDACLSSPNTVGGSDCCEANGTPGCTDPNCEAEICAFDSFCCTDEWDGQCASEALRNPVCQAGCGAALLEEAILAFDKENFGWLTPQDVVWVRGDLADVPNGAGYGFDASGTAAGAASLSASQEPPPGGILYWVVRPDCPLGSWSSGGPNQCGISSSAPPCVFDGIGFFGTRDFWLP